MRSRIVQFVLPAVLYAAWSSNHGNLMWRSTGYEQAITFFQAPANITVNSTYHQLNQLNLGDFVTSPFDHDLSSSEWYFTKYGYGKGVRLNNTNRGRRSYGRGRKFMPRAVASECSKFALVFALIDWMLTFFGFPNLRETLNGETDEGREGETALADMSGGEGPEIGIQGEESPRLAGLRDDDVDDGGGWAVRIWGRGYGWGLGCERD